MDVKKKIMFIIPSMRGGGSERVISLIVKYIDKTKFNVSLVLLKKEGHYLNDLPDDIKIIDLNTQRVRHSIFAIYRIIKIIKPDIVVSTLTHLNIYLAVIRKLYGNIKFIARESSIISISCKNVPYPKLFNWLYRKFYNNFDAVICQSEFMKNDLITNFNITREKLVVINNPIDFEAIDKLSNIEEELLPENKINLISVGRLNPVKGFNFLLNALVELDDKYHLTILGEGNEKDNLKSLVKKLNIESKVTFMGFQKNPYKFMKQADLFILSSLFEGFPNVVLEANACGTPVVAFNCPGGTGEIIIDGFNGFLVECRDVKHLAQTIIESSKYQWNSKKIIKYMTDKYGLKHIIHQYEDVIDAVL